MKKIKIMLIICMLLSLSCTFFASAETNKVWIVSLHYDSSKTADKITMNEVVLKYGYAPDMKLQPENSYRLDVLDDKNNVIYSFKFDIPNKIFTDITEENEIKGGIIVLNQTDFAIIVPYYQNSLKIAVYDEMNKQIFSFNPTKEQKNNFNVWIISSVIGFVLLLTIIILRKRKE